MFKGNITKTTTKFITAIHSDCKTSIKMYNTAVYLRYAKGIYIYFAQHLARVFSQFAQ